MLSTRWSPFPVFFCPLMVCVRRVRDGVSRPRRCHRATVAPFVIRGAVALYASCHGPLDAVEYDVAAPRRRGRDDARRRGGCENLRAHRTTTTPSPRRARESSRAGSPRTSTTSSTSSWTTCSS